MRELLTRIAVTGHMNLTATSVLLVYDAIVDAFTRLNSDELVGISCIARGADSVFAQAVLDCGGRLEVILPSTNYRASKVKPDHARQFDDLVSRASEVRVMPFEEANRRAYEAANAELLARCDLLFAVWDGQGSVDKGGTAAAVAEARTRGVSVDVIWPDEAARE
ncbi:hypothetical protein [Salinispora arenicola]|uniref:hypothetical protein n=1 Tax=Salinispora arenicola TaxID=168697 RepID=UPI0000EB957A|nr:hypothetical protein [Salinispora arenicola]